MDIDAITKVAELLAVIIAPIVAIVGIWKVLASIRLKIEAETRLKQSSEIETQIKLLELFSRLMNVAHGRSGNYFSETVAFQVASANTVEKDYSKAVITYPVGIASQDAAIAAIGTLGIQHEILREPAIQGLTVLKTFKPNAGKYLSLIEEKNG